MNLVKPSQLARLANVSGAHITQQLRPGGAFTGAKVGQLVDLDHPSIAAWLAKKGVDPTGLGPTPAPSPKKGKGPPPKPPSQTAPDRTGIEDSGSSSEPSKWLGYTLAELVRRFGGQPQFSNWLKDVATIETIRERRLSNEETERSLIRRDLVERTMLSLIEEQNQRLLNELPRTLARTLQTLTKAGKGLEAAEAETRKLIGQTLKTTQERLTRNLRKRK